MQSRTDSSFLAGVRPDGSTKIRPVDDMSRSLLNSAVLTTEKLGCHTLDCLLKAMRDLAVRSEVTFVSQVCFVLAWYMRRSLAAGAAGSVQG